MTVTEIAEDGSTVLHTLTAPARGFAAIVARRRAGVALALSTAVALAAATVIVPRTDFGTSAQQQLLRGPPGADEPTPYQLEEAAATATKLGHIAGYAGALLGPSLAAVLAAAFLFLGFRVAGTRPAFKATLAVTAHGMLPVWLGGLLAIPAAIVRAPLPIEDAGRLVPSSLAAWVGQVPPPLAVALSAIDLFALWAAALVAAGMARASGASRARAVAVTLVLFLAYVALVKVAPAGAGGGPGPRQP
jgi:hypothetical protein